MNSDEPSSTALYPQINETVNTEDKQSPKQEIPIHYISSDIPGKKWDGSPIRIITKIKRHPKEHSSCYYLDRPLFTCVDDVIKTTENPLINSEDCNPIFLLNLADRLSDDDMPYPAAIKEKVIKGIRAVFLEEATPRMFHDELSDYVALLFKDDAHPQTYRATAQLFFDSMANKSILAFDIHDLLHHPLQVSAWPEQFRAISGAASKAHAMKSERAERLKALTRLVWLATFEESLISMEGKLASFGCLNWLAPSETPLDKVADIRLLSRDDQKIAYRWHYLDALKDMYRIQFKNSENFDETLDWLERLGYATDEQFTHLIRSADPRPFEDLDYHDAQKFSIQAPSSPEELFANAIKLLEEEFGA